MMIMNFFLILISIVCIFLFSSVILVCINYIKSNSLAPKYKGLFFNSLVIVIMLLLIIYTMKNIIGLYYLN